MAKFLERKEITLSNICCITFAKCCTLQEMAASKRFGVECVFVLSNVLCVYISVSILAKESTKIAESLVQVK